MDNHSFGAWLKYLMKYRDVTQIQMCRDLGFDDSTVSKFITDKQVPTIEQMGMIAAYLHYDFSELENGLIFTDAMAKQYSSIKEFDETYKIEDLQNAFLELTVDPRTKNK